MNNAYTTQTDWQRLSHLPDEDIDTSDIPELDESFFNQAILKQVSQQVINLTLDGDIVEWLKQQSHYQQKINQLLREYMQTQQHEFSK
ncbi:MAG: BrnA antitoxin family protein [Methylococcales bacterium]|nr:BrnA antitoxin family protein [Methylococcales bacterium]